MTASTTLHRNSRSLRVAASADGIGGRLQAFGAAHAELAREVKLGRRDERVDARPRRALERLARLLDVLGAAARQGGDDRAANVRRDARHGLGIGLGRDWKSGLDDVHAERVERARHAQLLVHVHREAGRLLPVAERRVEDD
jgi:hypothetical protein